MTITRAINPQSMREQCGYVINVCSRSPIRFYPFAGRLDILKSINFKGLKDQARVPEGIATRARGFSSFREIICVQPTERPDSLRSLPKPRQFLLIQKAHTLVTFEIGSK